ncbi:hypothetical protein F8M41_022522 [Gigaspora margarita]|uniref:Uncharacterized protein n=1 Tax=Gigaspora margarita TaxID=4874 RepID=A0A8H4EVG7_GIGMA|nr:hypothetical protein F8M41_022522 [Gigaspora margarita]
MEFDKETAGFNCHYENKTREKAHKINQAKEIQVKNDEHEVLKNCERLTKSETEMNGQTKVKDKHKLFSCYKKFEGMNLINKAIECGHIDEIGIEQDKESNTANNLE